MVWHCCLQLLTGFKDCSPSLTPGLIHWVLAILHYCRGSGINWLLSPLFGIHPAHMALHPGCSAGKGHFWGTAGNGHLRHVWNPDHYQLSCGNRLHSPYGNPSSLHQLRRNFPDYHTGLYGSHYEYLRIWRTARAKACHEKRIPKKQHLEEEIHISVTNLTCCQYYEVSNILTEV